MTVGAEPKKVAILGGLLLVAAVVFYFNVFSTPDEASYATPPSPAAQPPSAIPEPGGSDAAPARAARGRASSGTFRPRVRPPRGEQRPDPMTIDPTLRLDLLAKLQTVDVEGTRRSIFDFGQPPAPKPDPIKEAAAKPVPNPIVPIKPVDAAEQAAVEPPKPQAPPIPLKFYGYVSPAAAQTQRRAFFTEGEDIYVVNEGELVKKRYRIVRIGVNSVVVEDIQFGSQQTLPLEEQQG